MEPEIIAAVIGATATIVAAIIAVIKVLPSKGRLRVSDIIVSQDSDGNSILDFRVHNEGGRDILINQVVCEALDIVSLRTAGGAPVSQIYDLDLSNLRKEGDKATCIVAQVIKPGEIDRFGVRLSVTDLEMGEYRCWILKSYLYTNYGTVKGKPVEVWLPHEIDDISYEEVRLASISVNRKR